MENIQPDIRNICSELSLIKIHVSQNNMMKTEKYTPEQTQEAIDYGLDKIGEHHQDTRTQFVIMKWNEYVYANQFLSAVVDMIGRYAVMFLKDSESLTFVDGYILCINMEEHWITLSMIKKDKNIAERTEEIVFKSIKKQL